MKYTKTLEKGKKLELVYILDKVPRIELNGKDVSKVIFLRCELSKINKFDIPFVMSIAKDEINIKYPDPKDSVSEWVLEEVGDFHKFILGFKTDFGHLTNFKNCLKEIGIETKEDYLSYYGVLTGANGSKAHYSKLLNIHRAYKTYGFYYLNYKLSEA